MSESAVNFQARWFTKPEAWILLTAVLAFVLKFDLALLTFGTNDVAIFYKFGRLLSEHGLQWIYLNNQYFNHPPLVGYYVRAIYDTAGAPPWEQGDISFPFLVRLPGIISDFVVVLIFLRLRKLWSLPTWSLIALALSPVSLMVSGFHGNTDPVMVMFLVVAAYMCVIKRPALCGIFLALSCQIKIVPLLLVPIFACFWFSNRKAGWFLGFFAAASGLFWLEPLLTVPGLLLRHVFLYGSYWGLWGITYWLRLSGHPAFATVDYVNLPSAETFVNGVLKLFIIAGVLVIAWRRRNVGARGLFESFAYAWIVFFIFSPRHRPAIHDLAGAIRARPFAVAFRASVVEQLIISLFFLQYPRSRPAVVFRDFHGRGEYGLDTVVPLALGGSNRGRDSHLGIRAARQSVVPLA